MQMVKCILISSLYRTYEELKHLRRILYGHCLDLRLYRTYEELKPCFFKSCGFFKKCLYRTYEELKLN